MEAKANHFCPGAEMVSQRVYGPLTALSLGPGTRRRLRFFLKHRTPFIGGVDLHLHTPPFHRWMLLCGQLRGSRFVWTETVKPFRLITFNIILPTRAPAPLRTILSLNLIVFEGKHNNILGTHNYSFPF